MMNVYSIIFCSLLFVLPLVQSCTNQASKVVAIEQQPEQDSIQVVLYYLTEQMTGYPESSDDPNLFRYGFNDLGIGYVPDNDFDTIVNSVFNMKLRPVDFKTHNGAQFMQIRLYKKGKILNTYGLTIGNIFFGKGDTEYAENDSLAFLLRKYGQFYYNYHPKDDLLTNFRELKKFNIDSNKLKRNYDLYQSNFEKLDLEDFSVRKIELKRKF